MPPSLQVVVDRIDGRRIVGGAPSPPPPLRYILLLRGLVRFGVLLRGLVRARFDVLRRRVAVAKAHGIIAQEIRHVGLDAWWNWDLNVRPGLVL